MAIIVCMYRLSETGYSIGIRCLELYTYRSSIQPTLYNHHSNQYQSYTSQNILHIQGKKEKNLINMLQFIHSTVWKQLFGKVADGLEKSTEREDECSCTHDCNTNAFMQRALDTTYMYSCLHVHDVCVCQIISTTRIH